MLRNSRLPLLVLGLLIVLVERRSCDPILNSTINGELGETCTQNSDCTVEDSVCDTTSLTCMCNDGFIESPDGMKCIPLSHAIGDNCEINAQCLVANSVCENNVCACASGFVSSMDKTKCLQKREIIGEECEEHAQCFANAECSGGALKCTCKNGFVSSLDKKRCLLIQYTIGNPCELSEQCGAPNSYCSEESKCACKDGFVPDPSLTNCIPESTARLIGQPCKSFVECPGTSECTNAGICACTEGQIVNVKLQDCLGIRNTLGSPCSEVQQCQQGELGPLSDCVDTDGGGKKVCHCSENAVNGGKSNKCLQRALQIGDACEIQEQCIVRLGSSQCLDGHCQCILPSKPTADLTKCVLSDNDDLKNEL